MDMVELVGCDSLLVTGDISEGDDVVFQLHRLADALRKPIYFVLGNHDFYHNSVDRTRLYVARSIAPQPMLRYLRDESVIMLTPGVGLVGEDGWGDATQGDYENTTVRLHDFDMIENFRATPPTTWKRQLQIFGRDAADRLDGKLRVASEACHHVIVATHVPPFRESCWYEGHTTDDNWAPFFVSGQTGEVIRQAAIENPSVRYDVYCGHTHHGGIAAIEPNLRVITGAATYGKPTINDVIEVV